MKDSISKILLAVLSFVFLSGLSANRVWYEARSNGMHRLNINYTVPEMQVSRDIWIEFRDPQKARTFYNHLIKGGDFFLPHEKASRVIQNAPGPQPW